MQTLFTEEIQRELSSIKINRGYAKKQFIYQASEDAQGLFYLEKGLVGLIFNSEKGNEHLLRLFKPGQFFGHRSLFAEEKYHASAICLENSEVYFIEQKNIFNIISRFPEMAMYFLKTLSQELRHCEVHRVMVTDKEVIQRAAESIVYLSELSPDHKWTRQEIAEYCESTTSTIIRALAKLEDLKLIEQNGHKINILDKEALLKL